MQATRPPPGLTTYARRKGKPRALRISSSPVKATDREDLSLVEMTRRMKKRARQSVNSACPDLEQGLTDPGKFPKRSKKTHAVASTVSSNSDSLCSSSIFPLESLTSLNDGTNNLQYQTPFNLSPVSSPTAPDPLSPVPPSRRHLSGTTSRNLKENRSAKRLASPFHSRSVSKACSRSGSRTNSPSKVKKPPFYIKARTRSEANARPGESVTDEVSLPVCGSLPALGSMKAAVWDHDPADSTTAYMLENLSAQDWFRPAKALSRSPFPEDYVPPGTPFQEWDYSAETFLGGTPLQTSTPNAVKKGAVRRHKSTDALSNSVDPTHPSNDVNHNTMDTFNAESLESGRVMRRHHHDSIFSSFDVSTTLSTSTIRPNSMIMENTLQSDPALSAVTRISDPGQAVVNLSGMLDCLEIDGMFYSRALLPSTRPYVGPALIVRAYSPAPFFLAPLTIYSQGFADRNLHLVFNRHGEQSTKFCSTLSFP